MVKYKNRIKIRKNKTDTGIQKSGRGKDRRTFIDNSALQWRHTSFIFC